ncbi:beta-galactosidase 8-like [Silene latifolia]|uniref:beta-galactosidase 8-like n=1 Tax=Silene latifolia TaxID=37657 RepID=UPI003D78507E
MAMLPKFIPQSLKYNLDSSGVLGSSWSWFSEPIGISKKSAFVKPGLLEQINTTSDQSDYLWYSIVMKGDEQVLQNGSQTVLHVSSLGHGLHTFINGKLADTRYSPNGNHHISVDFPVTLNSGDNTIDFLSLTVGLQNYGAFFDLTGAGVTGPVSLRSSNGGLTVDLSAQPWTYQIGLKGEDAELSSGSSSLWESPVFPKNQPLTWYKVIAASGAVKHEE